MEAGAECLSSREIRRRVRQLPRERRKEIGRAIRNGRAVDDRRDAALALALAENLARKRRFWPWWVMPRRRPTGWRVWAWILHLAWMLGALAYACAVVLPSAWGALPGVWRWVVAGFLAYAWISMPFTIAWMLRIYWNAPEAARKNRALLTHNR